MRISSAFLGLLLGFWCSSVLPQRAQAESGPHAGFLEQYAATHHFSLGRPTSIRFSKDGQKIFFLRSGPRSFVRNLYEYDIESQSERLLASASQLLGGDKEQLAAEELARRERMRLTGRGIVSYRLSNKDRNILIPLSGSLYVLDRKTGESRELKSDGGYPIDPRFSPDGKSIACVRDGDLFVMNLKTGTEKQLTHGANETRTHGLAEFVAQEEMSRMNGYWWSPDSQRIVYQETDTSDVEVWRIADLAKPGREPKTWRYPRPGKNNAKVRLGIISATGGETTWIDWDRKKYPYLAKVIWSKGAPLTLLVQNRLQTEMVLLTVDPKRGETSELLKETDSAWLNLDHAMPRWLSGGKSFLWSSERSGHWQLELRRRDGSLVSTLTPPELNYRSLVSVDNKKKVAYVRGGKNPTHEHLFRISLEKDGLPPKQLTDKPGVHRAIFAGRGGAMVRIPPGLKSRYEVVRGDGSSAGQIASRAEEPPFEPNLEMVTVGDKNDLHVAIVRPRDFDGHLLYPVIVDVYGGPSSRKVVFDPKRYLLNQWIADHGFIVVSIDGRGTAARGREWERSVKGNVIKLPLDDQVRGLEKLCDRYVEMDRSRVGIYGWSFGGYFSAMAVAQRPNVFHAGVAGAPVVDWQDYDTHYTERYMGLPEENKEGYRAASVLTYAKDLHRPLLIIHGTADDNVYFLHSMKLCDALFREGKQFDFLPLAGLTHMVPEPQVTARLYQRITEYFLEHLKPSK